MGATERERERGRKGEAELFVYSMCCLYLVVGRSGLTNLVR